MFINSHKNKLIEKMSTFVRKQLYMMTLKTQFAKIEETEEEREIDKEIEVQSDSENCVETEETN